MNPVRSNLGYVIPQGEAALVTTGGMSNIALCLPKLDGKIGMPVTAIYLMACLARYHREPGFAKEQMAWMEEAEASRLHAEEAGRLRGRVAARSAADRSSAAAC